MLLKKIGQYSKIYPFSEIIPLSAQSGENLKEFMTVWKGICLKDLSTFLMIW